MKIQVISPGLMTTVQDLGRWGYQGQGMPVAGAMDTFSLQAGNILVGNSKNMAALEITVMGPSLSISKGEGMLSLTGAELDLKINGQNAPTWTAIHIREGDQIRIGGPLGPGSRAYLCFSGGIEVPPVLGSRSTYLRAGIGGLDGRGLKKDDRLSTGENPVLWQRCEGFEVSPAIRRILAPQTSETPLRVVLGPQDDLFTDEGITTFLRSEYTISKDADRMGYRLEGPSVQHKSGADIVSDAIPLGSIQIPGHGKPIAMLADRQTTGGYTKIAVLISPDIAALAQQLPGHKVRFQAVSFAEALSLHRKNIESLAKLEATRASYRSRPVSPSRTSGKGHWNLTLEDASYDIFWEELD